MSHTPSVCHFRIITSSRQMIDGSRWEELINSQSYRFSPSLNSTHVPFHSDQAEPPSSPCWTKWLLHFVHRSGRKKSNGWSLANGCSLVVSLRYTLHPSVHFTLVFRLIQAWCRSPTMTERINMHQYWRQWMSHIRTITQFSSMTEWVRNIRRANWLFISLVDHSSTWLRRSLFL